MHNYHWGLAIINSAAILYKDRMRYKLLCIVFFVLTCAALTQYGGWLRVLCVIPSDIAWPNDKPYGYFYVDVIWRYYILKFLWQITALLWSLGEIRLSVLKEMGGVHLLAMCACGPTGMYNLRQVHMCLYYRLPCPTIRPLPTHLLPSFDTIGLQASYTIVMIMTNFAARINGFP